MLFLFLISRFKKMSEWRLLWFWCQLSTSLVSWFKNSKLSANLVLPLKKMTLISPKPQNIGEEEKMPLLDLPELTLESILERLSPAGLCTMAAVCTTMRDMCRSDHFWEKHMEKKWGRLIGGAALIEWQWHVASSMKKPRLNGKTKQKGIFNFRSLWIQQNGTGNGGERICSVDDSVIALYLSLEKGEFWFPAQVYNRENGHVGFMLSCYDARLCYDSQTDTFQARYSPHGRLMTEENISWDRLRVPPVDTPAHVLHVSECLNDLKPGDHIEIQWRRNKDFPYGWWYGAVGHLESCDCSDHHCHCHTTDGATPEGGICNFLNSWEVCDNSARLRGDTMVLEFNQYARGSQWRRKMVKRKDHMEEGDEAGFMEKSGRFTKRRRSRRGSACGQTKSWSNCFMIANITYVRY